MSKNVYFDSHRTRPSLLSSDGPPGDYTGFRNLALLFLFLTNLRLVIENMAKYGVLLTVPTLHELFGDPWSWPSVSICLSMQVFVLHALVIERASVHLGLPSKVQGYWHAFNIIAGLCVPTCLVWTVPSNEGAAVMVMLLTVTLFMKLVSYASVNVHERSVKGTPAEDNDKRVRYPANLTLGDLYYFIAAPTVCYQLDYPRSPKIRKGWLLRRIAEMVFFSVLIVAIVSQYIVPTVENAMPAMERLHFAKIVERILKLSVPNAYVWLLGFYTLFHVYLNVLAEVLRFGDREFYRDWWNSMTVDRFWRTWNMPVHMWMARHVYMPAIRRGYSKLTSGMFCFFVSALAHELIISVAFRSPGYFAFLAMMVQAPVAFLTKTMFEGKPMGNVVLWLTLMLGQPVGIILYYQDWYVKNKLLNA